MGCIGCIFGWIRNILAIIGLITVIIAIVIGALLWWTNRPSAIEGGMHDVKITKTAADNFDEKWEGFTGGIAGEKTLTLTEEEVSSKVTYMATELGIPAVEAEKVWVNFEPGSVHVSIAIEGRIAHIPLTMHVSAEGEIDIVEKDDGTKVLRYKIDNYSLPKLLKSIIEKNIGERFDIAFDTEWHEWELPNGGNIGLTSIDVVKVGEEYQLVINGSLI